MPRRKIQKQDSEFEALSQSNNSQDGKYNSICFDTRISLIKKVCFEKIRIYEAAQVLGLKISTAKYILKCFRKQGKIHRKNYEKDDDIAKDQKQVLQIWNKIHQLQQLRLQNRSKRIKQKKGKGRINVITNEKDQGATKTGHIFTQNEVVDQKQKPAQCYYQSSTPQVCQVIYPYFIIYPIPYQGTQNIDEFNNLSVYHWRD